MNLSQVWRIIWPMRKPQPPDHPHSEQHELDSLTHRIHQLEIIVSALTDAVTALQGSVASNTDATNAAVAKITGITAPSDAAEVAAAVTALGDAKTTLDANSAALNAAQPALAP